MTGIIICLHGSAGSGKTYTAKHLVDKHGFIELSFAGALKDITAILTGWDRQKLNGNGEDRKWRDKFQDPEFYDMTPRQVLQQLGTDVMRDHFKKDIWLTVLKRQLNQLSGRNIVISDGRFINEMEMIKNLGGVIVDIENYKLKKAIKKIEPFSITNWINKIIKFILFDAWNAKKYDSKSHISEQLVYDGDYKIINNMDEKYLADLDILIAKIKYDKTYSPINKIN